MPFCTLISLYIDFRNLLKIYYALQKYAECEFKLNGLIISVLYVVIDFGNGKKLKL